MYMQTERWIQGIRRNEDECSYCLNIVWVGAWGERHCIDIISSTLITMRLYGWDD